MAITFCIDELRRLVIVFRYAIASIWIQISVRKNNVAKNLCSSTMLKIEVENGSFQ